MHGFASVSDRGQSRVFDSINCGNLLVWCAGAMYIHDTGKQVSIPFGDLFGDMSEWVMQFGGTSGPGLRLFVYRNTVEAKMWWDILRLYKLLGFTMGGRKGPSGWWKRKAPAERRDMLEVAERQI